MEMKDAMAEVWMLLSNTQLQMVLNLILLILTQPNKELVHLMQLMLYSKILHTMMLPQTIMLNYKLLSLNNQPQLPLKLIAKVSKVILVVFMMMLDVEPT